MGNIPIEKIARMLEVYREKLATAETPPIDHAACIRLSGQINLLEDLFYMAHSGAQANPLPCGHPATAIDPYDNSCLICKHTERAA